MQARGRAIRTGFQSVAVVLLTAAAGLAAFAAEPSPSSSAQGEMLLTNDLGQVVKTPVDSVPESLRPSSGIGLKHQTPHTHKGMELTGEVLEKLEALWAGRPQFEFFPAVPPPLMSYLYSNDEFGNTAIRPGALIDVAPFEPEVQQAKYWLSRSGLRYTLAQTFTYAGITDVMQGDTSLGNYNLDLTAKWTIFDASSAGTAGWISTQIEYQTAIGVGGPTQNAQTNIGSLTNPTAFWSSHSGWRVPELAWQQSFAAGHFVALVGMINQGNYLDANAYANSGRGQFINSALVNTLVMPLPAYGYGANLQWQPNSDWYAMFGGSAGSGAPGEAPKQDLSWTTWSLLWELGYAPGDVLGLGPGVYRVQPFVARADGPVQGGLCFNFQQQLGAKSPLGWYGRLGFGGSQVTGGAKAQVSTGLVMNAPLKRAGWAPQLSNDLLGAGVVWSQPSATTKTVYHNNEYVFETFYTLQLSPMSQLQPDLQIVWNPAFNPDPGPAVVFQFQFILKW
jgi:porin